jgi:hypothetical protein
VPSASFGAPPEPLLADFAVVVDASVESPDATVVFEESFDDALLDPPPHAPLSSNEATSGMRTARG